jgi:DNA-binding transcriptional LysR family regulator
MDRMDDLAAFLAIVEKGGQTAAARHLGRSLQSINRSLASLERSVGVELVSRTTRRSSPTEPGLAFYRRVKPAVSEINDAKLEAANRRTDLSGLIRVSAPVLFAPAYIVPAVCEFLEQHPQIEIELRVSDRPVDIIEQGLDLAVRIRHLPDSRLKARRVADLRAVVFGSPAYFAKYGRPKRPDQLTQHLCILRAPDDDVERWPFRIAGRNKAIRVQGRLHTDSTAAVHTAVARGLGIGRAPLWQIRSLVDAGAVEVILEDFETSKIPVHIVWSPSKMQLARNRLLMDFLAARLKSARL